MSLTREVQTVIETQLDVFGPEVVSVCGLGAAGKTKFCDTLQTTFGGLIVATDVYLKYPSAVRCQRIADALASEDPTQIDQEENPKNWYNWLKFRQDIIRLRNGEKVELEGVWNQATGEKDLDITLDPHVEGPIWCDGIYMLHPPVINAADFIIMLTADEGEVAARRHARDNHRSSPEYLAQKLAIAKKYDVPYFEEFGANAQVVINNTNYHEPYVERAP